MYYNSIRLRIAALARVGIDLCISMRIHWYVQYATVVSISLYECFDPVLLWFTRDTGWDLSVHENPPSFHRLRCCMMVGSWPERLGSECPASLLTLSMRCAGASSLSWLTCSNQTMTIKRSRVIILEKWNVRCP